MIKSMWLEIMGLHETFLYDVPPSGTEASNKTVHSNAMLDEQAPTAADLEDPLVRESRRIADKAQTLEELYEAIKSFEGCELKKSAQHTVLFDGSPKADVVLLGEAPGASEDEYGIPFCGESGRLLDLMLQSIGLDRKKDVYITNTVFWRPPANRKPTNMEVELCRPLTEKHIALLNPKVLVLVGATALSCLLGADKQITKIRGQYVRYKNRYMSKSVATTAIFHPAYLLRQPMKKKETWFDLLKLKETLRDN